MRRHSDTKCRTTGFSLVELTLAMLAASVLALTAGLMLFYSYTALRRDRDGAAMQQDGRMAMELISRTVRSGTNLIVQTIQPGDLRADFSNCTVRIFADGKNLKYVSVTGTTNTVINGCLVSFAVSNVAGRVQFALSMETGNGTHLETLEGGYRCRNN